MNNFNNRIGLDGIYYYGGHFGTFHFLLQVSFTIKQNLLTAMIVIILQDFSTFFQIFLSPQVEWSVVIVIIHRFAVMFPFRK